MAPSGCSTVLINSSTLLCLARLQHYSENGFHARGCKFLFIGPSVLYNTQYSTVSQYKISSLVVAALKINGQGEIH